MPDDLARDLSSWYWLARGEEKSREERRMAHTCHATGCTKTVPARMFACREHWYALPKAIRDRIWANYRPGQCDDWEISHEYAEAAREAVRYLAKLDGVEPDTSVYDALDPEE